MNAGRTIFSQLIEHISPYEFRKCVERYEGNRKTRVLSCWDQFLAMAFAQLTYRESLRDIEACLRSLGPKLYHAGIRARISRSTLADANEKRDWRIYGDFAQTLIAQARALYAGESLGFELEGAAYALDATNIELCLSMFPWATFRPGEGAMKLHTLLDLRASIPRLVVITHANVYETHALDRMPLEAGATYVVDRGYTNWATLNRIHRAGAFFVIRAKSNLRARRLRSRAPEEAGVRCDQTVVFRNSDARKAYPEGIRRVAWRDPESAKRLVFLTNRFDLPASSVARLYKCRWQVELFFKWIKQHLRIKAFYGTSLNAVKTQIWIAISVYVLVAIVRKRLAPTQSLHTILQILSLSLFEKTPLLQAFSNKPDAKTEDHGAKQLELFDF